MPKKENKDQKEKKTKASGKGEKFADMSADAPIINEPSAEEIAKKISTVEKVKIPKVRGKKYQAAKAKVKNKAYPASQAIELLKEISRNKKLNTLEIHLNVTEKGLSGEVTLPHFSGKAQKVVVFSDEIAEEIKAGKINFDVLLASAADMPKILPLAKVLGPKGLMPNPKNGTLVPDPQKARESFSGNTLRYKTEKDFPLIHTTIGKLDQPTEELVENLNALVKAVNPKNIKKAVVKSTMSPGIKVSL